MVRFCLLLLVAACCLEFSLAVRDTTRENLGAIEADYTVKDVEEPTSLLTAAEASIEAETLARGKAAEAEVESEVEAEVEANTREEAEELTSLIKEGAKLYSSLPPQGESLAEALYNIGVQRQYKDKDLDRAEEAYGGAVIAAAPDQHPADIGIAKLALAALMDLQKERGDEARIPALS